VAQQLTAEGHLTLGGDGEGGDGAGCRRIQP
jgi:hypothetical protein